MATMNKDQLSEHIKGVVLPLIKETNGAELAEAVAAQIAKATESNNADIAARVAAFMPAVEPAKDEVKARTKGEAYGRIARAIAQSKLDGGGRQGVLDSLDASGDGDLVKQMEDARTKALAAGSGPSGGYIVPVQQATEVIDLRYAQTVVRGSGIPTVPLPTGTLNMPKIATGASGAYLGENTNITKSEQTFGNVQLTAKKLAVLVPISNDLVRTSSPSVDALVRDDIVRSLSVTEDTEFLRGTGTGSGPKGLRNWVNASNVVAGQTTSLANVTADLGSAMLKLMEANVPMGGWRWTFAPRIWKYLFTVLDSNGNPAFRPELSSGSLFGFPFSMTTTVPITLVKGANSDNSEVYLHNPADLVIGDNLNLSMDVSTEAAYHDGSNLVAAFSQDQTVIRAIAEHDLAARQDKGIAVITDVRWGV